MTFNRFHPRVRWIAAPAIAVLLAGACSGDDDTGATDTTDPVGELTDDVTEASEDAQADLEEALRDAGLTSLASAVSQVDLSEQLEGNEFTVFAPNDDAFLALDSDDLSALLEDPAQILDLLQNHLVVGEQLTADDLADTDSVTAESGETLSVDGTGDPITIEGATVVSTETAGDGVIHVIDTVLMVGANS